VNTFPSLFAGQRDRKWENGARDLSRAGVAASINDSIVLFVNAGLN